MGSRGNSGEAIPECWPARTQDATPLEASRETRVYAMAAKKSIQPRHMEAARAAAESR